MTQELPRPKQRIYCNRTLNMRSIRAVGFDMDYTLVHYRPEVFERLAFEHVRDRLVERGWPLAETSFDPDFVMLGLIVDTKYGNIVKANRFGYVKRACHGTRMLDFKEQRDLYGRVLVDLRDERWSFMNTLFSLSAASLYAYAVDLLDAQQIGETLGYPEVYKAIRACMDEEHVFGQLKPDIMKNPNEFVDVDPELPLTLLDLKQAGKKLLLITNSAWDYTQAMMEHALGQSMPSGESWRDLFEIIIVSARKPRFFDTAGPVYEVIEGGLLKPFYKRLEPGGIYHGGNAGMVEDSLGLSGSELLYVGDHIFADVTASKSMLRWRTALVVRELEVELETLEAFGQQQQHLSELMDRKELLEHGLAIDRLELMRREHRYGPMSKRSVKAIRADAETLRQQLALLDDQITPLARDSGELLNSRWGLLMRAGNDKSHFARQIERHADVYTSRVSNFLHHSPFGYLRSPRGSLPHDDGTVESLSSTTTTSDEKR